MNESVVLPAREAIHSYVAHVRHHLADLPPEELDELIGGLEADLAERATELPDGADLTTAFGEPEAYAAELRSAAGLPPRVVTPPPPPPRVSVLRQNEASWRAWGDAQQVRHPWLGELRPVWWLARGAILVGLPLLTIGARAWNPVVWLGMGIGALASFAWSRRRPTASTWANRIAIIGSLVAMVLALPMVATFMARSGWSGGTQTVYVGPDTSGPAVGTDGVWVNGEPATNLYAYDAEGNRIDRVRLYNQYGQAVAVPGDALIPWSQQVGTTVGIGPDGQPLKHPIPLKADGSLDVNRVIFPIRWGDLTGWQPSTGGWEPPVKISTLPTDPRASADPSASATPAPSASPASPAASPSPSETAAGASPSPSATP